MRRAAGVIAAGLALLAPTGAAAAHRRKPPPKPSLRISGLSVNQQYFRPGTTVTLRSPVNACYGIGGASQSPLDVQVFVFLHAVRVPRSAPITFDLTTPWDHEMLPDASEPKPTFGRDFFLDKGHGAALAFGGATGPYDFYRYDDEGTGSNIFNGRYVVNVSAKVHGKVLRARGAITVACQ